MHHRHDLPEWSYVNGEVKAFNRKLVKLMKPYKHVTVLRTDLDRKYFTKQGMHMNNLGKERMALELPNTTASILLKQEVISSSWKNKQEISMGDGPNEVDISLQEEHNITSSVLTNVEASSDDTVPDGSIHMRPRISKRQKRPPTTKTDNYLW